MTRQLKIIYVLLFLPLLTGSLTFFYWFYKRIWFAADADIELIAFFTIIGYFLFALIGIILSINFLSKNRSEWKKVLIPILMIGITYQVANLCWTLYNSLSDKAFVRVINDTDLQIKRVWSDNFEISNFEENDKIISFYPVYTYDWEKESSGFHRYEINSLHIDMKPKNGSVLTFDLPDIRKGSCMTIQLSEIIKEKK